MTVENGFWSCASCRSEEMCGPGDRLTGPDRMLNQIFAARAFVPHCGDELSRRVQLR
jgi:hypothetical protein